MLAYAGRESDLVSDSEEPAKPAINSRQWRGNVDSARAREPYLPVTKRAVPVRRGLLLILFGVLAIGAMIPQLTTGKAYPACDNSVEIGRASCRERVSPYV